MPRAPSTSPALVILGVLIVGNAALRGGVDDLAIGASALLAAAALLLALVRERRRRRPDEPRGVELPLLVPGLALAVAAVAAQLVPLPPGLVARLSPRAAELLAGAPASLGAWPARSPLSLDPGATALELAKNATWLAAAAAAALLARSRERRDALLGAVALSGPLVVSLHFGNSLFLATPILAPSFPFVNPNHLAGFLLLAAWPALGFALRARGPARAGWLLAFAFSVAGIFVSLSRGGIAAFFVGLGVFAALAPLAGARPRVPAPEEEGPPPPRRALRALRAWSFIGLAVAGALALGAFFALDRVLGEMRTVAEAGTADVKLGLWPVALRIIRDHPLTGIGRGAFGTVFPAYKLEPLQVTFSHVENQFLQLPIDLGLGIGLLVPLLFAGTLLGAARRPELSRPSAGALAGLAAVLAHNLFDFSLEIGGVALPFAVVAGALAQGGRGVRLPRRAAMAGAAALGLLALGAFAVGRAHAVERDAAPVLAARTADEALTAARPALRWHPADWVLPAAVGAKLATEDRCGEAGPFLLRAMARNPTAPAPHRAYARCAARQGRRGTAQREYRLAFLLGDAEALSEADLAFPGELLAVAPQTPEGLLEAGRILASRPAEARIAYARAWELFGDRDGLAELAALTVRQGEVEEGLRLARLLVERAPDDPRGHLVVARALARRDDDEGERGALEAGLARAPASTELLVALGNHHLRHRRWAQAKATFERIVAREGYEVARKKWLVATALLAQDRVTEALAAVQEAHDASPDEAGPLVEMAKLLARLERFDEALAAAEAASHKPGVTPGALDALVADLKAARLRAAVPAPAPRR